MQVSSVNRIPKPKPKIEKKPAKEEPASNGKTPSSESASNETEPTENSQDSKASEEDQSASKSDNSEPESHDELWILRTLFGAPLEQVGKMHITQEGSTRISSGCSKFLNFLLTTKRWGYVGFQRAVDAIGLKNLIHSFWSLYSSSMGDIS
jgi:hypothetical protein